MLCYATCHHWSIEDTHKGVNSNFACGCTLFDAFEICLIKMCGIAFLGMSELHCLSGNLPIFTSVSCPCTFVMLLHARTISNVSSQHDKTNVLHGQCESLTPLEIRREKTQRLTKTLQGLEIHAVVQNATFWHVSVTSICNCHWQQTDMHELNKMTNWMSQFLHSAFCFVAAWQCLQFHCSCHPPHHRAIPHMFASAS